jgi:hypothetical protein
MAGILLILEKPDDAWSGFRVSLSTLNIRLMFRLFGRGNSSLDLLIYIMPRPHLSLIPVKGRNLKEYGNIQNNQMSSL